MEVFTEEQVLIVPCDTDTAVTETVELDPILVTDTKTIVVNNPTQEVIYIASPGPQGAPGVVGELQFNTLVAPTETRSLDSVNIGLVDAVLWEVTLVDRATGHKIMSTVRGSTVAGNPVHTIGPIYGSPLSQLPHFIDVILVSGELTLYVTNNHTAPITGEVLRIKTNRVDL